MNYSNVECKNYKIGTEESHYKLGYEKSHAVCEWKLIQWQGNVVFCYLLSALYIILKACLLNK